ncbi:hypothetical protein [Burkholderia phage vB_BpP_HN04]
MKPTPVVDSEFDQYELTRELDKTKSEVFMSGSSAFYGPIMCSLEFMWSRDIQTAATDGVHLYWSDKFFMKTKPVTRKCTLRHELEHVGRLHRLRGIGKDPRDWNIACDYIINNAMKKEGWEFDPDDIKVYIDDDYADLSEEEVYELIHSGKIEPKLPPGANLDDDMLEEEEPTPEEIAANISIVVQAIHAAKMSGNPGAIPGCVEQVIDRFLNPVIPWEKELAKFMTELQDFYYTWARPERRYMSQDIYLPSMEDDEGALEHLCYYLDVSGSITDKDVIRFNSEVKYIKEQLRPKKLTLVLFDTIIQQEIVFNEDDPFDRVVVVGQGGTCLAPVREHIEKNKPTAAVIFSDLEVTPMVKPSRNIPVLWVRIGNTGHKPSFGKIITIRS